MPISGAYLVAWWAVFWLLVPKGYPLRALAFIPGATSEAAPSAISSLRSG